MTASFLKWQFFFPILKNIIMFYIYENVLGHNGTANLLMFYFSSSGFAILCYHFILEMTFKNSCLLFIILPNWWDLKKKNTESYVKGKIWYNFPPKIKISLFCHINLSCNFISGFIVRFVYEDNVTPGWFLHKISWKFQKIRFFDNFRLLLRIF